MTQAEALLLLDRCTTAELEWVASECLLDAGSRPEMTAAIVRLNEISGGFPMHFMGLRRFLSAASALFTSGVVSGGAFGGFTRADARLLLNEGTTKRELRRIAVDFGIPPRGCSRADLLEVLLDYLERTGKPLQLPPEAWKRAVETMTGAQLERCAARTGSTVSAPGPVTRAARIASLLNRNLP